MSPTSAAILMNVSAFWISFPASRPRRLTAVNTTIERMATSCWVERLTAYRPTTMGSTRKLLGETHSMRTPVKLANATATAAIFPVCVIRKSVQPNRNPTADP